MRRLIAGEPYGDFSRVVGLTIVVAMFACAGFGLAFVDAPSVPLVTEVTEWRGLNA